MFSVDCVDVRPIGLLLTDLNHIAFCRVFAVLFYHVYQRVAMLKGHVFAV